jgi:carboxypeptidase family protein
MRNTHGNIRFVLAVASVVALSFLLPTAAAAQSAITGLVTDNTGGVLPGVSVEAASPALIEQTRSVATDSQGRYSIVDLRPGVYTVTFSLTGFGTVKVEKLELPSTFTATVNAEMRVGALEESVTVSGASPVVDVQTATRTEILTRDLVDALPVARGVTSIATLVPGVRMSAPDVGGSQAMEQTYGSAFGAGTNYNTYEVDGMKLNSLSGDGRRTSYFNNALFQEVSMQTSGHSAETSAGGLRMNLIPREGGNAFHGQLYAGGTASSWQWDNIDAALRAKGLTEGDAVAHVRDINIAQGGPILRNRVWFFASVALQSVDELVADTVLDNGDQGREDQYVNNLTGRFTWQVTSRNKVNVYADRIWKFKGHEMGSLTDPETAAGRRDPVLYFMGQVKYVSTLSSRLMLDAGYATNILRYTIYYQPGIRKPRGSTEWFAGARRVDRDLGTSWGAATPEVLRIPDRHMYSAAATYVTGSHSFKTGVQYSWGYYREFYDANADLTQEYRSGVPDSVLVYNTPADSVTRMNVDLGLFAQDSWTVNRLTVSPGVRLDWFKGSIGETTQASGRFAPVRYFGGQTGLPDWFDVSPRFGMTYDLTGDAKTALKFTANKYLPGEATQYPKDFDPVYLASERRTWRDANGDDIAQESEIGASPNRNFGVRSVPTADPNHLREHSREYSVQLQRELRRGLAVTGGWYRRSYHHLSRTSNLLRSVNDWTPVTIISPLNGERIVAYNLVSTKFGLVDDFRTNSTDADKRSMVFDGFEFSSAGRLPGGSQVTGSWTMGRTINVQCDSTDNPNTFRFCDQRELGMPYRHDFKVAANYRLPFAFEASAVLTSYAGNATAINWTITPSTRYSDGARVIPSMTESSLTVRLVSPAERYLPRWNQLDLGVKRIFRFGDRQLQADINVFNLTNANTILGENTTWGSNLGRPSSVLKGRLLRMAVQAKW